jgi:hypothetical protein
MFQGAKILLCKNFAKCPGAFGKESPNPAVENDTNFFSTKHVTADKINQLGFKTCGRKV